jgi:hypothetical protein
VHAVLVETTGKQRYIFSTNKLREVVGASELVAASTTDWVTDAVASVSHDDPRVRVEPVLTVSGLALITVAGTGEEHESAVCRELIWKITHHALTTAPGLRVLGVFKPLGDRGEMTRDDLIELRDSLERVKATGSPPEARLQRLPVTSACRTSDGPAAGRFDDLSGDGPEQLSEASIAKRRNNHEGRGRIAGRLAPYNQRPEPYALIAASRMERRLSGDVPWLGIVHADGNGFGAMLRRLGELPPTRTYQDLYQASSAALEQCGGQALDEAAAWLATTCDDGELPLIPLIASGDDLTVLVDGRYALGFTVAYLRAFETHTRDSPVLREVAERLTGRDALTASAGVAIVKPHFPFSVAYELAEQACDSAKKLSRRSAAQEGTGIPICTLDWHVHYDSVGADLRRLRAGQHSVDGGSLLRRPYAVDPPPAAEAVTRGRHWSRLDSLVTELPVLAHPDPGEALPATQLFRLRQALIGDGGVAADRLFAVLCARPELAALRRLGGDGDGLFAAVPRLDGPGGATEKSAILLDFLDARLFFGHPDDDSDEPDNGAVPETIPAGEVA